MVLTPTQTTQTVRFNVVDDSISENTEYFSAMISTDEELVEVTVPNTQVFINDTDSESDQEIINR